MTNMNPLTKPIQSRINRLAHRQALQHEQRIKSELMERLQNARTDGASLEVLTRLLDELESVPAPTLSCVAGDAAKTAGLKKRGYILVTLNRQKQKYHPG